MAGGAASRDPHCEVVKIEPAFVKAQRGRELARRQGVRQVESSHLKYHGGGWRAQRRGREPRLRPARSRPARLGRTERERQNAAKRHAFDHKLALDLRRRRRGRLPRRSSGADRLLGVSNLGARLRHSLKRLDGLKREVAARLDPGNCRRKPRETPPIAAQGRVKSDIGRPERAAVGGRKTKRGRERGKVRRLGLGGPEQLCVVTLRRRQEAAAPCELRPGKLRGRIDVVALLPAPGGVERDARATACRCRRRTQTKLTQQRARVWGI